MEGDSGSFEWDYNKLLMNHLGQISNLLVRPSEDEYAKKSHLVLMIMLFEAYIPESIKTKDYREQIAKEMLITNLNFADLMRRLNYSINLLANKGYLLTIELEELRM